MQVPAGSWPVAAPGWLHRGIACAARQVQRTRRLTIFRSCCLAAAIVVAAPPVPPVVAQTTHQSGQQIVRPSLRPVTVGFMRHAFGAWTSRIADGGLDLATGRSIRWFAFDTDSAVVAAMASGRLDLGLMGTSVAAAALARGLDFRIFYVLGASGDSEGLVVARNAPFKLDDPKTLKNMVVAVPFGSTPHFRLLQSLRRWNVAPGSMRMVNLQAPQIADAWMRGELDATVVSEPLLGRLKAHGHGIALPRSAVQDGVLVFAGAADFVSQHDVFLSRLIDVMSRAETLREPQAASAGEERADVRSIAFLTGLEPAEVLASMTRYTAPPLDEQASAKWLGGGAASALAAELKACIEIWRWGGRIDRAEVELHTAISPDAVIRALTYQR